MNFKNVVISALFSLLIASSSAHSATPLAKVGERVITVEEVNRAVGSMPSGGALGEGDSLDKNLRALEVLKGMIDSELLYQEAEKTGVTSTAEFKRGSSAYRDTVLADLYRRKLFDEGIKTTEADVEKFVKEKGVSKETAKALMESGKRKELIRNETARLYTKHKVEYSPDLATAGDTSFKDASELAKCDLFSINYGDLKEQLSRFGTSKKDLVDYLTGVVEEKLFAAEGAAANLAASERYKEQAPEYDRSLAVNIYRARLAAKTAPSKKDIKNYIAANPYLKYKPRLVAALMIVTATEDEADKVRKEAMAGANFYELAAQRSIAPDAKATAGRLGPMTIGDRPYTSLDKAILAVKPGEITKPVKGDKGYSIFKVLEVMPKVKRSAKEAEGIARQALLEAAFEKELDVLRKSGKVFIMTAPVQMEKKADK